MEKKRKNMRGNKEIDRRKTKRRTATTRDEQRKGGRRKTGIFENKKRTRMERAWKAGGG